MCGIAGVAGPGWSSMDLMPMLQALARRGPDGTGVHTDPAAGVALGHTRLSIIDLSDAAAQPMQGRDGQSWIVLNGEIYNYRELRRELADYPYHSASDTEVLLAAYERWGDALLDRLIGMFAFAIWDGRRRRLFCARDRFGVKPFYYARLKDGTLAFASEIKAIHAAGVTVAPDALTWRQYLAHGLQEHSSRTFYEDVQSLPAGHSLVWENGRSTVTRWYDLLGVVRDRFPDRRGEGEVQAEYHSLLAQSIALRFRADVPVAINVSGGLDSSILLALVNTVEHADRTARAFTFTCGDERYDETPWVRAMLATTRHPWSICELRPEQVPELAARMADAQDEPFGGMPTLAYSRLFAAATDLGIKVLLDGQGLDEQWAGYDYYDRESLAIGVQGSRAPAARTDLLSPEFPGQSEDPVGTLCGPVVPPIVERRLRDIVAAKIPRALRFNDRASMLHSCELREPFLDHRLVELALAQPPDRLVRDGERKWLLRRMACGLVPPELRTAPKRPLQTPQREWLAGVLAPWALDTVHASRWYGEWFRPGAIERALQDLQTGQTDNSFAVWQMISVALCETVARCREADGATIPMGCVDIRSDARSSSPRG